MLTEFKAASSSAEVKYLSQQLHVRAPAQQWAYAATAPLDGITGLSPVQVEISASVDSGEMGFGVLNRDGTHFIAEKGLPAPQEGKVILPIPSPAEASRLVVRSWAPTGTISTAIVRSIVIRPDKALEEELVSEQRTAKDLAKYWFIAQLRAQVPELGRGDASDLEKVRAVREWAYQEIPRAVVAKEYPASGPPEQLFFTFDKFQGGLVCGGTAELLAEIYRYLGYAAYTYNMGTTTDGLSHVTTAVTINYRGSDVLSVQDAYFNYELDEGSKPADMRTVLNALAHDHPSSIEVVNGKSDCKPAILPVGDVDRVRLMFAPYYKLGHVTVRNGMAEFCHDFTIETYPGIGNYTSWLQQSVGKRNLLYLFLFPLGTSGGTEIEQVAQQAEKIQKALLASVPSETGSSSGTK